MKRCLIQLFIIMSLLLISTASVSATDSQEQRVQVRQLIESYLKAVMVGDTSAAKALLAGNLLAKNQALLDSEGYGAVLADIYAIAEYSIEDIAKGNNGEWWVNVEIAISPNDKMKSQYIVADESEPSAASAEGKYKIIDEIKPDI